MINQRVCGHRIFDDECGKEFPEGYIFKETEVYLEESAGLHIDVGPGIVICKVNWLYYLNYEDITRISSTCHYYVQGTSLGQTALSYGWCDGIPSIIPSFSFSRERLHV